MSYVIRCCREERSFYVQPLLSSLIPFFCHTEEFTCNQSHPPPPVYKHAAGPFAVRIHERVSDQPLINILCTDARLALHHVGQKIRKKHIGWTLCGWSRWFWMDAFSEDGGENKRHKSALRLWFSQMWLCNWGRSDAEAGFELKSVSKVQLCNIC